MNNVLEYGYVSLNKKNEELCGDKVEMTMSTPNVYSLTVEVGIRIAGYCLGNHGKSGYYTPSMLLGSHFIDSIPGIDIRVL